MPLISMWLEIAIGKMLGFYVNETNGEIAQLVRAQHS